MESYTYTVQELIDILQEYPNKDAPVLCQSSGCCRHGHKIVKIDKGVGDEAGCLIIRAR